MIPETIWTALISHGSIGIIAAVLLYLYVQKDKELGASNAARIAEANAGRDLALSIANKTNDAVVKLRELAELQKNARNP